MDLDRWWTILGLVFVLLLTIVLVLAHPEEKP
jgi:hypothetical protein